MTDTTVSMSREQGFLEAFFLSISQFGHEKAKELAEKEREAIKTQIGSVWNSMLTLLAQLAIAEKSYMTLNFLASKGFLRKDNSLKSTYELLRVELYKIEEAVKNSTGESLEKVTAHLCGHLGHFVAVRLELIDFYEKLYSMSANRVINCDELFQQISVISQASQKNFHHPYLTQLKTSFSYECDTLSLLLNAQQEMQQWSFLPSLLRLHSAHVKLVEWGALSQLKETRRLSFGPGFLKPQQLPHLYQWLVKFKGFLVSKFTLYFHEILSKQTNQQEMKNFCSKAPVDLYHKMGTFQRKTDAICIALVFGVHGCDTYKGHGYHHPDKVMEPPKGLDSFPAVVSYPGEKPLIHWPNVIMIMEDRAVELNTLDRVVCFYDKHVNCTYIIVRAELKMTFVIIFSGKRSEKESYIAAFLEDFCSQLRLHRVLATLRPGNK